VFYVTDLENRPLEGDRARGLREEMKRVLDRSRNS